ncbi:GNAT family N-acetyltransferase [Telmatospirillum siberiense]|uniref:GNAT family N-acetyltransferase n=1 Tax=Telmatospirillum siberiense TaxID=382514 RepID=A0A2N3PSZ0_9PROT|nr:GNAT family N-acetyltransferase [Telmatospirillum siberiense]PKU23486.1 GNAT family N-acetyltransferase [Telmatospirillum siberiense]
MTSPKIAVRFEVLGRQHDVSAFDCGRDSLDTYLRDHALSAPAHGLGRTWVAVDDQRSPLAYYTLSLATFARADAPLRVANGMPAYPIPALLLARLAVTRSVQGQSLGLVCLDAAMKRAVTIARSPDGLPVRCLMVHAIDSLAAEFYRKRGFEASPTNPLHLFMLLKDLEAYYG